MSTLKIKPISLTTNKQDDRVNENIHHIKKKKRKSKSKKKPEVLTDRDIMQLMGMDRERYHRVKGRVKRQ